MGWGARIRALRALPESSIVPKFLDGKNRLCELMNATQSQSIAAPLIEAAEKQLFMSCFAFDLVSVVEALKRARGRGSTPVLHADREHTAKGSTKEMLLRLQELQDERDYNGCSRHWWRYPAHQNLTNRRGPVTGRDHRTEALRFQPWSN